MLTRWLDRLANFDNKIKHIPKKHLALTDYMSRNPLSKTDQIENNDKENVINCAIPLLEFIASYCNVASQKKTKTRTDQNERCEQKTSQSETSEKKTNGPKSEKIKLNKRSSLLPHPNTVDHTEINVIQSSRSTNNIAQQTDRTN